MIAISNRKTGGRNSGSGKVRHLPKRTASNASPQPATSEDPRTEFSSAEWEDMVATHAYYLAQARGFDEGSADEDWYAAESELRERFRTAGGAVETEA